MPSLKSSNKFSPQLQGLRTILREEKIRRGISGDAIEWAGGIEASRERCKSLAQFIKEAWPALLPNVRYDHNWHIDFLCRHLEAVTHGEMLARGLENRLLINEPPGVMKSLLIGVFWPAWEMGPAGLSHLQYIVSSHRDENCTRDTMRMRTLIMSDWYQQRWPMVLVKTSERHLENASGGWRKAIPFGSLTGERGDR